MCKNVIQIDCARLEGPKIATEKDLGGSIQVEKKIHEKKGAFVSDSRAGPASYSESRGFSLRQ